MELQQKYNCERYNYDYYLHPELIAERLKEKRLADEQYQRLIAEREKRLAEERQRRRVKHDARKLILSKGTCPRCHATGVWLKDVGGLATELTGLSPDIPIIAGYPSLCLACLKEVCENIECSICHEKLEIGTFIGWDKNNEFGFDRDGLIDILNVPAMLRFYWEQKNINFDPQIVDGRKFICSSCVEKCLQTGHVETRGSLPNGGKSSRQQIRVGGIVKGLVKNVQQYGAFVDLNGTTGFLYVGEMRWTFTSDARDVVAVGQEITAKVIEIDQSFDPPRFNLSLRQLQPKPKTDSNPDSPQIVSDHTDPSAIVSVGKAVPKDKDILIDGSNIVRWFPELKSKALCMVMAGLERAGYNAYIIFDATIPYVLKETDDRVGQAFLDFLRESKPECVKIAPPDSQADDFILSYANAHGNHIISNDRFRQYVSRYPWVGNKNEQGRRVHRVEEIKGEIVLPTLGISVP